MPLLRANELPDKIISHGFPSNRAKLIHTFVGGSSLHGVKLDGTDDTDLYGIYLENPLDVIWEKFEHFVTSTADHGERNTKDDVDVTCYSLRKFARLALAGNPTIIQMLFTPAAYNEIIWSEILFHRDKFIAKSHIKKYMGYADAQLHRMMGTKGRGKHGQRPELEGQHGYDTKAAMHIFRLLFEGMQLVSDGWITFPRPEPEKSYLLSIRKGERSEDWVIREATKLFEECKKVAEISKLPDNPDHKFVGKLITNIYLQEWEKWT